MLLHQVLNDEPRADPVTAFLATWDDLFGDGQDLLADGTQRPRHSGRHGSLSEGEPVQARPVGRGKAQRLVPA